MQYVTVLCMQYVTVLHMQYVTVLCMQYVTQFEACQVTGSRDTEFSRH